MKRTALGPAPPHHLLDALLSHSRDRPRSVFCHLVGRGYLSELTFGDLAARAADYAAAYRERGNGPGAPVLVILQHGVELFPAFLGAMLAGCVPSFMPFPSPKQDARRYWREHRALFERIAPGAVVTWADNAGPLRSELPAATACFCPEDVPPRGAALPDLCVSPASTAFLQHSSGTTGLKKGVELSYGAVADQVACLAHALRLVPEDRFATWLPLYHDMGLISSFITPLTLGLSIVALDPFEWVTRPELILEVIERHGCTHTWWPNFAFQHVASLHDPARRYDLRTMKAFVSCSEPCKPLAFRMFLDAFRDSGVRAEQLAVSYAMAEAVFCVTQTPPGRAVPSCVLDPAALSSSGQAVPPTDASGGVEHLSAGAPIEGVELAIVGESGEELADDHVGEIALRARFLFSGYYKNPEETRRKFRGGWYLTGDVGFRRGGNLFVLGRRDDRIIVYGKNFFAHDIEAIAGAVDGIKKGRTVAFGVYSPEIGSEEVVVLAEPEEDEPSGRALRKVIKAEISERLSLTVKVRIVPHGWIVKTTSGKVSRSQNQAKYLAELRNEEKSSDT